ncbi:MAG: hypothetical protein LBB94_12485 [Clostridiales bacterium]|jgi:RNA polymerase sigma-70 factor (ECF subfamily)|nr:hypothetical protein [Clostridiales bacterium]
MGEMRVHPFSCHPLSKTEVSQAVYLTFCQFVKTERNLWRWDERHTEYSELTGETLNDRAKLTPKTVDETAIEAESNQALHMAIAELPEVQRRRLLLYCEHGMEYEECSQEQGQNTQEGQATELVPLVVP